MKWYQILVLGIYSIFGLSFLYRGVLTTFVYFANKNLGHYETFFPNGWNLIAGIILSFFAYSGYVIFSGESNSKIYSWIVWLPMIAILIYILWAIIILISGSIGKWN
jgi:hypothetical protein